jgi:putative membrane protein
VESRLERRLVGLVGHELVMVTFWSLLIWGVAWFARSRHDSVPGGAGPPTEQILARRMARGEIDEQEYRRRLAALSQTDRTETPA